MQIGKMDRRVQFQRANMIDDGFAAVEVFAAHGAPVWAAKRDVSDGERYRAAEVQAHLSARFVIRWSAFAADLTPRDRLVCDGRVFDIVGIKEMEGRRSFLEITAAARVDQ